MTKKPLSRAVEVAKLTEQLVDLHHDFDALEAVNDRYRLQLHEETVRRQALETMLEKLLQAVEDARERVNAKLERVGGET